MATTTATTPALEEQYTSNELAKLWKLDPTTIQRMFRDEPGVFKKRETRGLAKKREYVTLRIPASVAIRVYNARCR